MITIKAFFVKEADKLNILKHIFNVIDIHNNELIMQPLKDNLKQRKINRITRKIVKICKKKNVASIVLSKRLKSNQELVNEIIENNIHVFNGRWLFNYMAYDAVEYILQQNGRKKEKTEISILTNNLTHPSIETIKMLVKEYKRVNVVTNNIDKFKYLENKIYNEYGIMITVTNNKRKSLQKSEIILNFDFSKELLNKYNIYDEAIIINIQGNMKITKKRFNGLNLNDYEIWSTKAYDYFEIGKINDFDLKDLLEAELYRRDSFYNIRQDIVKGHFKIKNLS
ncbi:MAG: hypothetical protein IKF83_04670 [Clostridia bacterium]|nr:hypothetical protein [Clostridia bacterium]